jgi:hypothetical protein
VTSNQEILRFYVKEIAPNGDHDLADDAEVAQTTMDLSTEAKLDYNDAARSLDLAAQHLDVTTKQLVAAVGTLRAFTNRGIRDAIWELSRVVNVVRRIEGTLRAADPEGR